VGLCNKSNKSQPNRQGSGKDLFLGQRKQDLEKIAFFDVRAIVVNDAVKVHQI
jgi:hypothetical protein